MKILLTVHQFFPDYISGTEVLTYSVAKALIAKGHQVTVFTGHPARSILADHERFDQYDYEGIKVHRFHHAHAPMGNQNVVSEIEHCNLLAASYFKNLVRQIRPEVIHYFHLSRLGSALIDVGLGENIPSLFTPTDFWMLCPTSQLLLTNGKMCGGPSKTGGNCVKHVAELTRGKRVAALMKAMPTKAIDAMIFAAKRARFISNPLRNEIVALSQRGNFLIERLNKLDAIIAPTQLMFDSLKSNGVSAEKILLSAYGIDTTPYAKTRRLRQLRKPLNIGFIGTLSEHKGCHVLIDAVSKLPNGSYSLKIYGSPHHFPAYFSRLEQAAQGNSSVTFCGTFPNSEIGNILSDIDVLVVPSLWYENTPLVIYSAMAAGCPAIVSDFPGMTEAVHDGVNGLSFTSGDYNQLHDRLCRLMNEPELLKHLSTNCHPPKSVVEYTDELLALYKNTQAKKASRTLPKDSPAIPDFNFQRQFSINGWVLARNRALKSIALTKDDHTICETTAFSLRGDVLHGYKTRKISPKSPDIGFSLAFDNEPDDAQLNICTSDGRCVTVPLRELAAGKVANKDDLYIGIDRMNFSLQTTTS